MNDTVKGIVPEDDREHIISLYGHIKGVEREIDIIKTNHFLKVDSILKGVNSLSKTVFKLHIVLLNNICGTNTALLTADALILCERVGKFLQKKFTF